MSMMTAVIKFINRIMVMPLGNQRVVLCSCCCVHDSHPQVCELCAGHDNAIRKMHNYMLDIMSAICKCLIFDTVPPCTLFSFSALHFNTFPGIRLLEYVGLVVMFLWKILEGNSIFHWEQEKESPSHGWPKWSPLKKFNNPPIYVVALSQGGTSTNLSTHIADGTHPSSNMQSNLGAYFKSSVNDAYNLSPLMAAPCLTGDRNPWLQGKA